MRRAAEGFEVDVRLTYPGWFEDDTNLGPEVKPG